MRFLRALLAFLALPAVVSGLLPWLILRDDRWRTAGTPLAWPVSFFGAGVLLWCVRDFYVIGKGTLAPWDPPKRLVTVGLYRFAQNVLKRRAKMTPCRFAAVPFNKGDKQRE